MTEELKSFYITTCASPGMYLSRRIFECVEMHDKSYIVTFEVTTGGLAIKRILYRLMPNDQ